MGTSKPSKKKNIFGIKKRAAPKVIASVPQIVKKESAEKKPDTSSTSTDSGENTRLTALCREYCPAPVEKNTEAETEESSTEYYTTNPPWQAEYYEPNSSVPTHRHLVRTKCRCVERFSPGGDVSHYFAPGRCSYCSAKI